MNPTTIRTAYVLTKRGLDALADYRDRKAAEAFDVLESAKDLAKDVGKDVEKRVEQSVEKHVEKPKRKRKTGLLLALLAAAVAGGAYAYLQNRKVPVAPEPPRVPETEGESRLVYTTVTPQEGVPERDEELLDALEKQLEDMDQEEEKN